MTVLLSLIFAMESDSALSALPPELLIQIAAEGSEQDLINFRQTSKKMNKIVEQVVKTNSSKYTNLCFIYNPDAYLKNHFNHMHQKIQKLPLLNAFSDEQLEALSGYQKHSIAESSCLFLYNAFGNDHVQWKPRYQEKYKNNLHPWLVKTYAKHPSLFLNVKVEDNCYLLIGEDAQDNDQIQVKAGANCSNIPITYLPYAMFLEAKEIKELDLSNNQILDLPVEIGNLENLEKLLLSNETNVTFARVNQNGHILGGNFDKFYYNISGNWQGEYTDEKENRKDIQFLPDADKEYLLQWAQNSVQEFPPEISKLSKLQELRIFNNRLTRFPSNIINILNLRILELDGNNLMEWPDDINSLVNIESLQLCNRVRINTLPSKIIKNESIFNVIIEGCIPGMAGNLLFKNLAQNISHEDLEYLKIKYPQYF